MQDFYHQPCRYSCTAPSGPNVPELLFEPFRKSFPLIMLLLHVPEPVLTVNAPYLIFPGMSQRRGDLEMVRALLENQAYVRSGSFDALQLAVEILGC